MAWDQGRGAQKEATEVVDARRGVAPDAAAGGGGGAQLLPPGGKVEPLHCPANDGTERAREERMRA